MSETEKVKRLELEITYLRKELKTTRVIVVLVALFFTALFVIALMFLDGCLNG